MLKQDFFISSRRKIILKSISVAVSVQVWTKAFANKFFLFRQRCDASLYVLFEIFESLTETSFPFIPFRYGFFMKKII